MTDSIDKKSKENRGQSSQNESLHTRLSSIDKKLNGKRDSFDVDLDAMLDEAESSLAPANEFQDDEDTIDRLLMNAGFDSGDMLMQAEMKQGARVVEDATLHDELDDFLSFDDFGEDFNQPLSSSSNAPLINNGGSQDDEDDLDRLLMNAGFDADDVPVQSKVDDVSALEELDDFSDFNDFNEPDTLPSAEVEAPEQAADEADDFFGLGDDFDASDLIQDDQPEASVPALIAADEEPQAVAEDSAVEEEVDTIEELDDFSDFSDFNEPDTLPSVDVEAPEQAVDEADDFFGLGDDFDASDLIQDDQPEAAPALIAADEGPQAVVEDSAVEEEVDTIEELDDFSDFSDFNEPDTLPSVDVEAPEQAVDEADDFFGLGDDFNASDLIQDDQPEASASALIAADEEPQAAAEDSAVEEEVDTIAELDDFSDFSDFNEPDTLPSAELEVPEQAVDEADDFFGLGDDFDASDLIQDDQPEASAPVLIAPDEEPQAGVEEPELAADDADDLFGLGDVFDESDLLSDDESEASAPAVANAIAPDDEQQTVVEMAPENSLLPDAGFDTEDALEQVNGTSDDFVDDFSGLGDDFNESDLIQDDEVDASAPALADLSTPNEEQQTVVEESDLQDDESFNNLFADFDAEDSVEQTAVKKDGFGDDADLSEIDNFFQLDEVSDDFSSQTEEAQLADSDSEKSSTQDDLDDDFLLPDFDITAGTETSDMGTGSGIKEDELLADDFGDTDFLNEDEAVQASEPERSELKSGGGEAVADSQSADSVENVKFSPFEFEQEDIEKKLEDAEQKVKKAKIFSYAALGFGAVALSAAAGLGVMTYNAKTEVSKLTEEVSTLKANLAKSSENNPKEEINAMRNSVVQLNQQVDGFITELKGNPLFSSDLLHNKVPDIAEKQYMVSKALDMLQAKMGLPVEKTSSEPVIAEAPRVEAVHEPAPAPPKIEAVHESAPTKEEAVHKIAPTKERAMHETVPVKVEAAPEIVPAKEKTQPEAVTAKPEVPAKAAFKEEPVKIKKQVAAAKWGVNLVAFKQEWFAKSKAAEFAGRGVFAEVIPIYEKNTTMYRLRVGGFKTKAEAYANTARIKQALNLDSVWVSDE